MEKKRDYIQPMVSIAFVLSEAVLWHCQPTNAHKNAYAAAVSTRRPLLYCQPRVAVTSCPVYKVIMDLALIDHSCINPIHRIGFILK